MTSPRYAIRFLDRLWGEVSRYEAETKEEAESLFFQLQATQEIRESLHKNPKVEFVEVIEEGSRKPLHYFETNLTPESAR